MGIDPAPFWANLHLYSYECAFMTNLMKTDKGRAMKFRYATRFIDDECNLNDGGEFGRSFPEIYPSNVSEMVWMISSVVAITFIVGSPIITRTQGGEDEKFFFFQIFNTLCALFTDFYILTDNRYELALY